MHPLRAYIQQFVSLTDAEWAPLAGAVRPLQLAKHQHLVRAGELCTTLAVAVRGALRLYYVLPNGDERTTYFFFEKHFLGDYPACLTGRLGQLNIQALSDCELLAFDYAVLRRLFDEFPVYERFGRLVAEYHLLGTDARLVEQLTLSPEARYRRLLASGKTKILERVPQQLVANYLGVTPVSLSRIRARVAAGG